METTTTTPVTAPRKTTRERTALKSLCSQLRIDPKTARRKLRKAGFSWHSTRERWTMTEKQLEAARNILKPPKAVKTKADPVKAEDKPN